MKHNFTVRLDPAGVEAPPPSTPPFSMKDHSGLPSKLDQSHDVGRQKYRVQQEYRRQLLDEAIGHEQHVARDSEAPERNHLTDREGCKDGARCRVAEKFHPL